jgi:ArsR family transcriptional regulator
LSKARRYLTSLDFAVIISTMVDKQLACVGSCTPGSREDNDDLSCDGNDGLSRLSELLHVISDKRRLRILAALTHQEMCVCDIMARLGMGQSLASHHLGVLKQAGLVRDRRDAQWVYYSIDPQRLAELNAYFRAALDVAHLAPDAAYGASPRIC